MKRFSSYFLFVVLIALSVASCHKDNNKSEETSTTLDNWVDLGLPSGLLWATRNVGASSPADYGDYIAWGETTPKDSYAQENYLYCDAESNCTKYNDSDNLITLQPSDDAATANYGGRLPTIDEWKELYNNTTSEWVNIDGVDGRCFTGQNGNSLFLPAGGWCVDSNLFNVDLSGSYWSAMRYDDDYWTAWYFDFNSDYAGRSDLSGRSSGLSVRAVSSAR